MTGIRPIQRCIIENIKLSLFLLDIENAKIGNQPLYSLTQVFRGDQSWLEMPRKLALNWGSNSTLTIKYATIN